MRQAAKDLEEADMRVYTRLIRNRQPTVLAKGSVRARLPFSLVKQLQSEETRHDVRRSR